MSWLLLIVVVLVFAGSFFADYKWRQWISKRKHDRDPR